MGLPWGGRLKSELSLPLISFPQLFPALRIVPDDALNRSVTVVRRVLGFTMAVYLLAVIFPGSEIPLCQKLSTYAYVVFSTVVSYRSVANSNRASGAHLTGFVLFTVGNAAFSLLASDNPVRALFWMLWLPGIYLERAMICGRRDTLRLLLAISSLLAVVSVTCFLWMNLLGSLGLRLALLIPAAHVGSLSILYLAAIRNDHFWTKFRARTVESEAKLKLNSHAATQLQLERINRSLTMGALAALIAHEINQPLASIVTNASAASRWLNDSNLDLDEARGAIARVVADGHRAGAMITSFRTMLREGEPRRAALQVNELVQEALEILRPEIQNRGVVVLTPSMQDQTGVLGDHIQLRQVFLNLMTNALDAMMAVIDRPRLLIVGWDRDDDGGVVVRVEDSGPGIMVKDPKKIFEAFFTTKDSGMGMGLFICRMIIEAHGGSLKVESRPGRTRFFVCLAGERLHS